MEEVQRCQVVVCGETLPRVCLEASFFQTAPLKSERQDLQGASVLYEKRLVCATEPTAVGSRQLQDTSKGLI